MKLGTIGVVGPTRVLCFHTNLNRERERVEIENVLAVITLCVLVINTLIEFSFRIRNTKI